MTTSELKAEVHRSCEGCGRYSIHPDGKNIPVMPQSCNGCYPWDDTDHIRSAWIPADLDADELRKCPKCGNEDEPLQACDHCGHTWYTTSKLDRGIERAEPPKPTGEQLKRTCGNCGMPAKDCGVSKFSREACEAVPAWCKEWTPKQPEPAEQVTNWEYGKGGLKQQTEPAAPVIRVCEQCGAVARNSLVNICSSCGGGFVKPKEPKAEPGLVFYPVNPYESGNYWEFEITPGGFKNLDQLFSMRKFHHIETKSGAIVTTLGAFDPNDPPVRAWFRK